MKTRLFRLFPSALLIFALGTLLLISCNREIETEVLDDDFIEMFITVGDDTKTLNEGLSTSWTTGDALSVIHSAPNVNTFWLSPFYWQGGYAFSGKVNKLSSQNDWYAIYPYDASHVSAENISLTFPSSQVQVGNSTMSHLAGETFPMVGKTEDVDRSANLNIKVHNVLAVEKYLVKNTSEFPLTVKEIEFTAPYAITGDFSVDMTGNDPVLTVNANASKTVKLSVEGGEQIAAGDEATFYMAVAPFVASAGEKLKFKITGEHPDNPGVNVYFYHTITLKEDISFASNSINSIGLDFDDNHSQNPDAGSAGGEVELEPGGQPENGVYLLVYKDGQTSKAFAAFEEFEGQGYAIDVTVENGIVIPQNGEDLSRFAITIEKAGIEHPNDPGHDAYNVKNSADKIIFYASGGSGDAILRISETNELFNSSSNATVSYYHTFIQKDDGVQILSSGAESGYNKYLLAYSSSKGFYYEKDNKGQKLHLFVLGGSTKEKQTLNFNPTIVEYDFDKGGDFPEPTLLGYHTDVTYSSSNESVATVDPISGSITINRAGTAVITATAAANEQYYSAKSEYTIIATSDQTRTFYLTTELIAGDEYVIISANNALTNKDGTIGATSLSSSANIVQIADDSMIWTATNTNSGITLSNKIETKTYYLRRASSNGSPSITTSTPSGNYYYWTYSGNQLSTSSGTKYYLYYSGSAWAQSTTSSQTVTIYSATKPLTPQSLSFDKSTIRWTVGDEEEHKLNGTYPIQAVIGAQTSVTYTSSNNGVAEVTGNNIIIRNFGATTITATAAATEEYKAGSASYTLYVIEPVSGGFDNLGVFNLENDALKEYLDRAEKEYTEDNITTLSFVEEYYNKYKNDFRTDVPKPVTVEWGTPSKGKATITVFEDQDLSREVWNWTATTNSTSFDIYNLIPGRTYYCTIVDEDGSSLRQVTFATEGRRRMMKVSDTSNPNNAGNCRDLGGLKTTDGKRIKYGMIYRGTNMTSTTAAEKKILAEFMNIGLDNDLRSGSGGSSSRDNPFEKTDYDVVYCGPGYSGTSDMQDASKYKQTIQAFIDCAKRGKASYFHCYIGSDRTGYTGLIIESLLGVSVSDCSIDYEMTTLASPIIGGKRLRNDGGSSSGGGYGFGGTMNYFRDGRNFINNKYSASNLTFQEKVIKYVNEELGISMDDINAFFDAVLEPVQ